MSDGTARAALRVVRGEPTAEELAAVTALLSAAGGGGEKAAPSVRGRWNDPAWQVRRPLQPGPGAWQAAVR